VIFPYGQAIASSRQLMDGISTVVPFWSGMENQLNAQFTRHGPGYAGISCLAPPSFVLNVKENNSSIDIAFINVILRARSD